MILPSVCAGTGRARWPELPWPGSRAGVVLQRSTTLAVWLLLRAAYAMGWFRAVSTETLAAVRHIRSCNPPPPNPLSRFLVGVWPRRRRCDTAHGSTPDRSFEVCRLHRCRRGCAGGRLQRCSVRLPPERAGARLDDRQLCRARPAPAAGGQRALGRGQTMALCDAAASVCRLGTLGGGRLRARAHDRTRHCPHQRA